jgi:integrase
MASLVKDKSGNYLVAFRWAGKQFTRSLDTRDETLAEAGVARVKETLMRLQRGWATMPPDAEPGIFISSGGQLVAKPVIAPEPVRSAPPPPVTIKELFELYVASLPAGKKESNTLVTERIHRNHVSRVLGDGTAVESLTLAEAQRYAARRSREEWNGKRISSDTIRKELKTLRYIWTLGQALGHVPSGCPWRLKDLHLGKDHGREPFRTREEIERRIARGGMSPAEIERLWVCLYLTGAEVKGCLDYVEKHASAPFVYPMFVFVALTGARRSELCRSRIDDFDFASRSVSLRERKRDQSKAETIRTVDMHDRLAEAMRDWIGRHPGSQFTLCQEHGSPVSIHLASGISTGRWPAARNGARSPGFIPSGTASPRSWPRRAWTSASSTLSWATRRRRCGGGTSTCFQFRGGGRSTSCLRRAGSYRAVAGTGSNPSFLSLVSSACDTIHSFERPRPTGRFSACTRPSRHHSRTVYSLLPRISPTSPVVYHSLTDCRSTSSASICSIRLRRSSIPCITPTPHKPRSGTPGSP